MRQIIVGAQKAIVPKLTAEENFIKSRFFEL